LRPIILLPAAMLTGLTPRQLEAVLAHELAHVRRHDYLVNWIQTTIETVLFYHPAVWWVSREIRQQRENCCDDLALSVCDDRIVYARALARVAELRSARYRSAVAETAVAATGGSLLDRIRRIVGPPAEGPTRRHAWLAGMLLLGVVLVATIGLMGVASDVAGDNGDGSENLQTELVFWHMIVDRVTAERITGQTTTPASDSMKRDVDVESSRLLETLRKAEADGTTIIPGGKMRWAQPHEWRARDHFLDGLIDSTTLKDLEGSTVRGDYDTRWSGNFTLTRVDRAIRMKLDASMIARLEFYLLGTNERLEYELRKGDRNDEFTARIEPEHARVWLRPMEQDAHADYCYVLVAQAVAVPKDLAEYVRSCNVTSRWIARGVEGALDDIRSALEWEKAAGPQADAATDSPACYTTPDGKRIEVVAISRPAKWPHRWWDMEGRPVQANPAWHKYAAGGALALVVRRDNQTDTVDFLIETPSFNGSAGSSEFGPGESLHYLTDASADGALSKYLDEGGEVRLSVKHGTGDWTEIATIKEGQELKADGGRFVLTKVDHRHSKRQPGLLGRIVGESEQPGLLLVDGKFDYDPAFEIQLAAVDTQGTRTMGPVTTGSGLFERDKDRRWYGFIQIDKADVDHFVILKRPVVGHVFEKIPAKPEAAPDQADMDTPSEPSPEAGHENTDQSLPPRSISGRVTDADGKPIAGASVEWGYILDPPAQWQGTKTESDGRYSLKLTAYGVGYRLGVSAPGKAPQWQLFYPPWSHVSKTPIPDKDAAPPETVDFALEPAHRLTGIVLDEQSQPIAGVWITARTSYDLDVSSFWGPEWATPIPGGVYASNTGHDGRFTLEGLPAEEVSLTLESPHRHVNEQSYAVDREHVIRMTGSGRPGTLCGVVVDATTGKPIPQFQVAIRYCPERQAFDSKEGRFTWSGELTEGRRYETHVHAKGYAPRKLKMKAGPVDRLEPSRVELEPARPLLGRLVDAETGKPLSGVSVYYGVTIDECSGQIEWNDLDKILRGSMGFDATQRATTDLRGEFWFCEAKDGPKGTLIVQAEGHGRLILPPADRPATQPDQPFEIGLRPEATISGVLPGAPADAQVVVQKLEPTYEKIRESIEYRPVDAAGRFRIGNLAPGKYQVYRIVKPNRSSSTFEPIATVTVTAGEHEQLEPTEGDTHSRKPEETQIENPVPSLRTTVFPPGSLVAAGADQAPPSTRPIAAVAAEPIDPAEVRRKIAALAVPDQTIPMDEQPVPWLYQRRKQIMPQLIAGLTDKNPTVAEQCLNILRDVPASKELTETLIAIAGDEQSPLRREVLRRLEPSAADPRVARLLDQAGNDAKSFADPVTRARWSGLAGRKDRAVELLKPLLAEPGKSPWDTVQAIRLLGEMREPAGIDLLEPIAAGGNWGMAVEAYKALAQIDPRNHGLTDDQRTLLDGARLYKETEEQLRRRIDGLAKLNPKEIRPLVMQMLRDTDHAAQYPALLILTAWKDKDALPRILELVQGDNRSYHQQQAVAAYLSIDGSPQAEKDVLDRLGTFGFGQSAYFEAVLRGIATAEMPDARKVAMLRAAGYNPQVPGAVPYAVGYMAGRGHDVGGILVPLMLEEKNLQPMARFCTVAASDKARRFGPLVGRAMSLLMSEPTVAAGGEKTTVSTAEAATLILDAVAVYDLKESAADVQKLANSRNAIIRNAAQAAGAKLGVPGTVNDLYVQLKSDDANV
ncbi:MAG: M48 family metalloprotease, partial [Pirellulaceae bacterium]|nr:M48 family metalloprotease [Pirellulaceae bacterium]